MCDFLRCTLTSLSWWKCACKGRREGDNRLRLPSVPFSWSLAVHSQSFAPTLQKTKYLRRRLVLVPCCHLEFFVYHKLLIISPPFIGPSTWKQKIYQTVSPPLPPNISPPLACLKMNSMIYFHLILHPVVHMYDFHIFMNLTLYDVLKLNKGSNSTSISISAATEQLWHCYVACFEN